MVSVSVLNLFHPVVVLSYSQAKAAEDCHCPALEKLTNIARGVVASQPALVCRQIVQSARALRLVFGFDEGSLAVFHPPPNKIGRPFGIFLNHLGDFVTEFLIAQRLGGDLLAGQQAFGQTCLPDGP